ncbi:hypothetical protein H7J93_17845 [Mycobacterium barrassiae]|uniref:hypothetical protein n=1 Tax=Mycobacterium barrassiae TaxID=319709 RepID=UPI002265BF49|nr:hypothetical protein [Mycobacterium barrassiae]MCV7301485.1 hypothetical protein [Mycobacterium barrassiae]
MSGSPLKKPEGISWNTASVELPQIPMLPAGLDAMSATIAAVLPTLAAQLTANVAALSAKEHTYSGKLGVAQAAYQNSDDAGSQSVGQVVGMLGKLGEQAGQMGQVAGAPTQTAQGGSGVFGSLIEQAMKAAQGGGVPTAAGAGQAPGPAPRDPLEERVERLEQRAENQQKLARADESRPGAGPAPVAPPEHVDEDLGRRLYR